jgi:hypothetical protein
LNKGYSSRRKNNERGDVQKSITISTGAMENYW